MPSAAFTFPNWDLCLGLRPVDLRPDPPESDRNGSLFAKSMAVKVCRAAILPFPQSRAVVLQWELGCCGFAARKMLVHKCRPLEIHDIVRLTYNFSTLI